MSRARPFRRQVGADVENDSIGVLPLNALLSDFLCRQVSAILSKRPKPHIRPIQSMIRIAEDGELLIDVAEALDQSFGRRGASRSVS